MVNAIEGAEHYVYIENQFFITNSGQEVIPQSNANIDKIFSMPQIAEEAGTYVQEIFNMGTGNVGSTAGADIVKNRIGQALVDRITRAHKYVIFRLFASVQCNYFIL